MINPKANSKISNGNRVNCSNSWSIRS